MYLGPTADEPGGGDITMGPAVTKHIRVPLGYDFSKPPNRQRPQATPEPRWSLLGWLLKLLSFARKVPDEVSCTVLLPHQVRRGETLALVVAVHHPEPQESGAMLCAGRFPSHVAMGSAQFVRPIYRHQPVVAQLALNGVAISPTPQHVTWAGTGDLITFTLTVPAQLPGHDLQGTVTAGEGGEVLAHIPFRVPLA
jgi:hypothetical protein